MHLPRSTRSTVLALAAVGLLGVGAAAGTSIAGAAGDDDTRRPVQLVAEDLSGNCDEAEHAADPECAGPAPSAAPATSGAPVTTPTTQAPPTTPTTPTTQTAPTVLTVPTTAAPAPTVPTTAPRVDDRGGRGRGTDDGPNHDVGDDHGGRGRGTDDSGRGRGRGGD